MIRLEAAIEKAAGQARLERQSGRRSGDALNKPGTPHKSDTIAESPEHRPHIDLLRLPEGFVPLAIPLVNPFHKDDPRHSVWADATLRATVELRAFNAAISDI